jgi:hypothetical protein
MNDELRHKIEELHERIDELEGVAKAKAAKQLDIKLDQRDTTKGPSQKALWHFFALCAEPWSKTTRLNNHKLRVVMETALPAKKRVVLGVIKNIQHVARFIFNQYGCIGGLTSVLRQDVSHHTNR